MRGRRYPYIYKNTHIKEVISKEIYTINANIKKDNEDLYNAHTKQRNDPEFLEAIASSKLMELDAEHLKKVTEYSIIESATIETL